ncbi:MAG: GNAT family N-acetyltransferase [Thermoplasmatota archaeon]
MRIVRATMNDAEAIARNNLDLRLETEKVRMDADLVVQGVRSLIAHSDWGFYLLAKEKRQVVGQVMVTYEWSDWRNQSIWWLHRIYVNKKWRRRGVFKQLFQRLKREAERNNVYALRVYLHEDNSEAGAVYSHVGMERSPFLIFSLLVDHAG